jgi:hypothetical protein
LRFNVAGLSMNSLAAQAFIFFVGGFETSSSTMTFCLYELSLHQDIQDRLWEEIDDVLQEYDGKLTYEGIQEMEYLDKVVSGEAQFLKNFTNTGYTLLNRAMSLEYLSLLHINFQSKLKLKNNQNLPLFSARDFFCLCPPFVFFISIFYTEYVPSFVSACWCQCILHRDIQYFTIKVIYSPTYAQVICLKNNIKTYIKIAPTCFGAVTPSSWSSLFVLVKVTRC